MHRRPACRHRGLGWRAAGPCRLLLIVLALATPIDPARAASVIGVAAVGDPAPGGGIFAGPGFVGRPQAGGEGWVAFRSLVAGGPSREEIILANMDPAQSTRISAARTGQVVSETLGTIDDFLGHPAVNARGDVAFVATLNPPTAPPADAPQPAAVLVYDVASAELAAVAVSGTATSLGLLALAEGRAGSSPDADERTPAIGDDGAVAFSGLALQGDVATEAIFMADDGGLTIPVRQGDAFGAGTLATLGPPAMNAARHLAFRATLVGDAVETGVFLLGQGALTLVAGTGTSVTTSEPEPHQQTLTDFGPVVDLDDGDAVALLGGPLIDFTRGAESTESDLGVLRWQAGTLEPVAYPGQAFLDRGRVTGTSLLPEFGSPAAPPVFDATGALVYYVELNAGSSAAVARATPAGAPPTEVAVAGGSAPTPTPIGGTYAAITAPPAVDATGGVVLIARLAGAPASDALLYRPDGAEFQAIVVGEPSPFSGGFLAGPAFVNPCVNDGSDVVFRSTVASGPSAVGIFRWRQGEMLPLVRSGDVAPVEGNPPFLDLVGEHDTNAAGAVVFAAIVDGLGRGIYRAEPGTVTAVAVEGDGVGLPNGVPATLTSLLPNPVIADDGAVAFRGRVEYTDPDSGATRRRDGVFLAGGGQTRAIALEDDPTPAGLPIRQFRELDAASGGRIAILAALGVEEETQRALFLASGSGLESLVVEGDQLGPGAVTALTSRPTMNDRGTVAQLVRLQMGPEEGAAIVRATAGRIDVAVQVGDAGPAGGTFRSLGRPAIASDGTIAFRGTFEPGSGGTAGLFGAGEGGITPLVSIGDPGPAAIGGQFTSFNQRLSVNGDRAVAFLAALAGGSVSDGLFLGQATTLTVQRLRIRIGTKTRPDRLRMKLRLASGALARTLDPNASRVRITVRDDGDVRWTELVPRGGFQVRKRSFAYTRKPTVKQVKLTIPKSGPLRALVRASPDLTRGGIVPITPPLSVDLEIAEIGAQTTVDCTVRSRRVRCR